MGRTSGVRPDNAAAAAAAADSTARPEGRLAADTPHVQDAAIHERELQRTNKP